MPTHIAILLAICLLIGFLGRYRKFGFWGYFFGSLLLTPLIGIILLLASDPKRDRR
ncbi:MAG: hypothetical protein Q3M30_09735 [Candidatus Electrothrix sp. Rat3]|nr:hypothetical protein [Candidatus Electrothrix rattekaaiensis]